MRRHQMFVRDYLNISKSYRIIIDLMHLVWLLGCLDKTIQMKTDNNLKLLSETITFFFPLLHYFIT